MDRLLPESPPRWTHDCRGCASSQTGCICERGVGVHVFATSPLGQGGRMQDWGIHVCVPEACEVWKCFARTCINNAAVCVVVQSYLMCIYIYIQHSSSNQYLKQQYFTSVKHGDFFSRGIIMQKKKSCSSVFLFPSDLSSHSRELPKWSNIFSGILSLITSRVFSDLTRQYTKNGCIKSNE